MAGSLTISTLSDGTNSTSATNAIRGSAKAWVNFNGISGAAIQSSYNVSSVTYNTTADYTVNFTTAMGNTTYCAVLGGGDGSAQRHTAVLSTGVASGSVRVKTWYTIYTGSGNDAAYVTVAIFSI